MSEDEFLYLFMDIRRVGAKLSLERDQDLKALDLTSGQSTSLLFIESHPGCPITELSEHLETTHQATRTLVERMKAKGLLETAVSERDARAKSINLTDKGRALCVELRRLGGDRASRALKDLTLAERDELRRILNKINSNLQNNKGKS